MHRHQQHKGTTEDRNGRRPAPGHDLSSHGLSSYEPDLQMADFTLPARKVTIPSPREDSSRFRVRDHAGAR
jgi:hypothetical protein